jgi:PAS domain S-box-containing protein
MQNYNELNEVQIKASIEQLLEKLRLKIQHSLLNTTSKQISNNIPSNTYSSDFPDQLVCEVAKTYFLQESIFSILEYVDSAISASNEQGEFVFVNRSFLKIFGYAQDELLNKKFSVLIVPEEQELVFEKHLSYFKDKVIEPFETIGQKKDGSKVNILISSKLYSDIDGLKYSISNISNITTEKNLSENLFRKDKIFEYTTQLLSIIGYDGYFKTLNPSWEKTLGWSLEELQSKPFIEFVHPDDVCNTNTVESKIFDGQEILKFQNRYICKDGTYKWLSWNAQLVPNENSMIAVAIDVTEEKELRDALNTKNLIFDFAHDLLCVAGFDGYYKMLNPTWEHVLGWSLKELMSKPFMDFVHPDDVEHTQNIEGEIINGKEVFLFENRILCANGSYKWMSWNSHPMPEKLIMIGVARDITESKEVLKKLVESEGMFKSLVEDSKAGVYIIQENKIVYANEAMCTIFGYTINELLSKPIIEIIQPADTEKLNQYSNQILSGFMLNKYIILEGKHKNGSSINVEVISNQTKYQGKVAIIGSLLDITQQNIHYAQLKKLYSAIEQTQASIVITDVEGSIEYVNDAFLKISGYTRKEALGKNPRILKSGITPKETYNEMWSNLTAKKNWKGVLINRKKNGDIYWESAIINPITNDAGEITNYVAVKEDITQKIGEEKERKLLIEELTRNNKELKQFSYITSHNLRAPLTNLLAIDALIDRSKITNAETLDLVEMMHESIGKLNTTLNDLIKILVIKEQTNIQLQEIVFEEVFKETVHSIKSILNEVEIQAEFSGLTNIKFNKTYLESIFLNLLTNSVKYAHPNRKPIIKIVTYALDDKLYLRFSDNGIGFNMENVKDRIFGLYQRFHSNSEGKGIGLYLVHSQITALGGNIEVYSEENVGTIFTICFNAKAIMPIKPSKG